MFPDLSFDFARKWYVVPALNDLIVILCAVRFFLFARLDLLYIEVNPYWTCEVDFSSVTQVIVAVEAVTDVVATAEIRGEVLSIADADTQKTVTMTKQPNDDL